MSHFSYLIVSNYKYFNNIIIIGLKYNDNKQLPKKKKKKLN